MRYLGLLSSVLVLSACASPLPSPDPSQAWVELRSNAGTLLMADRLDGQRLNDGRYFQVPAGAHELQARFQFEVNSGGGQDGLSEPRQVTCEIRIRHDNFVAGQRYRLEARPMQMKAQAWLYDAQRNVLARSKVLRCGTF
ncbi:hypothetical protein N1078_06260 [Pseudomonas sp. MIL19]|uniref:PA0061/PA0062 family lipoprotein n=1 Tax=Pseudomonas sp. MIL19 TaxID=2976979 RepID=UPI00236359EE|nr:hypothetical protein [Pseudomonas sp. MIL19]MBU0903111.1 hypothetical protein [Gammaproteobacteria bacterium]MDD2160184.1 hypothetical protein [Pseudomonas sp. MIL19]